MPVQPSKGARTATNIDSTPYQRPLRKNSQSRATIMMIQSSGWTTMPRTAAMRTMMIAMIMSSSTN
jgi:hypothetical protein